MISGELPEVVGDACTVDAALLRASLPAAEAAVQRALAGEVRDSEFLPVSALLSVHHLQTLSLAQRRAGASAAADATIAQLKARHPQHDVDLDNAFL